MHTVSLGTYQPHRAVHSGLHSVGELARHYLRTRSRHNSTRHNTVCAVGKRGCVLPDAVGKIRAFPSVIYYGVYGTLRQS